MARGGAALVSMLAYGTPVEAMPPPLPTPPMSMSLSPIQTSVGSGLGRLAMQSPLIAVGGHHHSRRTSRNSSSANLAGGATGSGSSRHGSSGNLAVQSAGHGAEGGLPLEALLTQAGSASEGGAHAAHAAMDADGSDGGGQGGRRGGGGPRPRRAMCRRVGASTSRGGAAGSLGVAGRARTTTRRKLPIKLPTRPAVATAFRPPTAPTPPLPPPTPTWRRVWWAQEEGAAAHRHSTRTACRARVLLGSPRTFLDGDESADGTSGNGGAPHWHSADGGNDSAGGGTDSVGMDGFFSSDAGEGEGGAVTLGPDGQPIRTRRYYRKTLRPTPSQLSALNLRSGANTITFSVHSALQGTQAVSSRVFLFESNAKLVISDVDGTITKSDVLGHLMPRVGYDWAHLGVTSLYSRITSNGYQMLYLTARGIGMAGTTRDYLASVQQDVLPSDGREAASSSAVGKHESRLPDGPCLLSPSGLIESLTREVILRKPEEFKIACLEDIRSLWPHSHNPFYAGFGNRGSDVVAYKAAGVPPCRILVINPQGDIRMGGQTEEYTWASYPKLVQLSNEMFPDVSSKGGGKDDGAGLTPTRTSPTSTSGGCPSRRRPSLGTSAVRAALPPPAARPPPLRLAGRLAGPDAAQATPVAVVAAAAAAEASLRSSELTAALAARLATARPARIARRRRAPRPRCA